MMTRLILISMLLLSLAACSSGGDGGAPVPAGNATQVLLPSGAGAIFPAGAFAVATNVNVTDSVSGDMDDAAGFPAGSGALLGATNIKVPAGVALATDIEVRIAVSPAQSTNDVFTIYSFNAATDMWETTAGTSSLKNIAATGPVSGGTIVSFTAPTMGTTGLDVSYGVFADLKTTDPGGGGGDPNEIPAVTLAADATTVDPDVVVNLTATGTDADDDTLTFAWLAPGGTLGTPATTGGTSTVTWSAAAGGTYVVSVSVDDGMGGVDTDAVSITVNTPAVVEPNAAPVFDGDISADLDHPHATQLVNLSVTVTDPDGDDLTVAWAGADGMANGAWDAESGKATIEWTPTADGTFSITVTADDGKGEASSVSATADVSADFVIEVMPTEFDVVGYEGCEMCHADHVTGWLTTDHATSLATNILTSPYGARNEHCWDCHGAGRFPVGEGGFISPDTTPQFQEIQCEACHGGGNPAGAGGGHKPSPWNPGVGYDRDAEGNYILVDGVYQYDEDYDGSGGYGCGLCHEGARHGSYEEWMESGHANFHLTEGDPEVPEHYLTAGYCNPCHSGIQFAVIADGRDPIDFSGLTLDDPLEDHLIGCATCHDPHGNEYHAQLRIASEGTVDIPYSLIDDEPTPVMGGSGNICIECHNGRRDRGNYEDHIAEGSAHFGPHGNPQAPMMWGIMGAELGNPPAVVDYGFEHAHTTWNENSCTTCHMYRKPYEDSDNPALWGHNFIPRFERCITCHGNFAGDEAGFWVWVDEYKAEIDVLKQAFLDAWPAGWKDGEGNPVNVEGDPPDGTGPPAMDPAGNAYRAALWNYKLVLNDGSNGVHNPTFTISLLEEAIAALGDLPAP